MVERANFVVGKGGLGVLPTKKRKFTKKIIRPENNDRFGGRA